MKNKVIKVSKPVDPIQQPPIKEKEDRNIENILILGIYRRQHVLSHKNHQEHIDSIKDLILESIIALKK
jgi:hypothetical protein